MDRLEKEARKRRTSNVYSSTYDNGGWSKRDSIPTGDPIGDVVEKEQDDYIDGCEKWKKDQEAYIEMMKKRLLVPKGKLIVPVEAILVYEMFNPKHHIEAEACCDKPNKYKNIISTSLKFWSCRNCGADLGDI